MKYYPSPQRSSWFFVSLITFLISSLFMLFAFASLFGIESVGESVLNFSISLLFALIPLKVWSDLVNIHPDVWITDEGFYVSVNIFWKTKIKWDSIVQIKELPQKKGVLVLARKITFFHRDFGEKGLHGVILPPRSTAPNLIDLIEKEVVSLSERITKVL